MFNTGLQYLLSYKNFGITKYKYFVSIGNIKEFLNYYNSQFVEINIYDNWNKQQIKLI